MARLLVLEGSKFPIIKVLSPECTYCIFYNGHKYTLIKFREKHENIGENRPAGVSFSEVGTV